MNTCYTCQGGAYPDATQRLCLNSAAAPAVNWQPAVAAMPACNEIQIWDATYGRCENCPAYTRAQNGGTACAADYCSGNQIVTAAGRCSACPFGSSPDVSRRSCPTAPAPPPPPPVPMRQSDICNDIQIRSADGWSCTNCPPYTRAQNGYLNCAADACGANSYVSVEGRCVTCGAGSQVDASGRSCRASRVAQSCNDRQIRHSDGYSCTDCQDYSRAQNSGTCAADACGDYQVITQIGTCQTCPAGSQPAPGRTACVRSAPVVTRPECNAREQISSDGRYCMPCPDYTRAQNQNQMCAADSCISSQIVTSDGQCAQCPAGSAPDGTRRQCQALVVTPTCTGEREALSTDRRRCERCPPFTKAQSGNTFCRADSCGSNDIVLQSGNCARCPANSAPDADRRNCIRTTPVCGDRERLSSDQRSCIPCQQYTRAQNANSNCAADACYSNQIVTVQGTCSTCPSDTRADAGRRLCNRITTCGPRERLSEYSCIPCDPYTRAQNGNAYCGADPCSGNARVDADGRCVYCPDYTRVMTDSRTCLATVCGGRQILERDGTCRECLEYTRPDALRRNCISEHCDANSRVNRQGVCEVCPAGYKLSSDKRFCEALAPAPRPPTPAFGRYKNVAMISISPLDRLLNQNDQSDEILVRVGCEDSASSYQSRAYDFVLPTASVDKITCHNGQMPAPGQVCKQDDFLSCGGGQPYMVELFDKAAQRRRGLASPPSLGSFKVTKQMMECMVDNKLQIHFQYGKRQALSGAVACFDHVDYIRTGRRADRQVEIQDETPVTNLNICHKNSQTQKRCFVYGYQVTIMVRDSERNPPNTYPMLEPKVFAKITFNAIKQKMVILPGDQISIRFASDFTPHEGLRLQPDIDSSMLPSPMKERYQIVDAAGIAATRLPCNDMKVADTVSCTDFVAHCTGPDDRITLAIQGAGDVFYLDQRCSDFFAKDADWGQLQNLLIQDVQAFNAKFQDGQGSGRQKEFKISEVTLRNKFGTQITSSGVFDFTYSIGWKFDSKEPRCFAGDYLKITKPTCELQCGSSQCLLESLKEPNKDKRMLQQDNMAGPDVSPPSSIASALPLTIPSRRLNLSEYNVPERLLQIFLSNYQRNSDATRNQNTISGDVEEGVAEPINLSASFYQDIGPAYSYDVLDKAVQENKPPAYIKITKVPKYGNIVVKQWGQQIVLNEGDLVQTSIFKDFTYDQGKEACSTKDEEKCKDSFSYVTFSEWVGKGPQQKSLININPVSSEVAIAAGLSAAPLKSAAGEAVQLTKEASQVESGSCSAQYPTGIVAGLGFGLMCLMVPLAIVFKSIKGLHEEAKKGGDKVTEFGSASKHRASGSQIPLSRGDEGTGAKQEDDSNQAFDTNAPKEAALEQAQPNTISEAQEVEKDGQQE